ncbi:MAG: lipocalin family protein, partial [Gemmatimonadota bacterium]
LRVPRATTEGRLGLDLRLRTQRPPVLHGAGGLSSKDARAEPHASWYVSLPRLETSGTLSVEGERFEVSGSTWLDHEFFSGGLAPGQVGWDWFSARLEDGRDLMLFRLRRADGSTAFAAGTVTAADGRSSRALDLRGATFEPAQRWTTAAGVTYPIAWRVRLPAEDLTLRTRTPLHGQEVESGRGVGFGYWEGIVDYAGTWRGSAVRGEGYVEMTGYDRPVELR